MNSDRQRHLTIESERQTNLPGFMCGPRLYEFDGWYFEFHSWCGPWPLKQDGELRKRAGSKFWKMIDKFCELSEEEKKEYRVGGGCIPI